MSSFKVATSLLAVWSDNCGRREDALSDYAASKETTALKDGTFLCLKELMRNLSKASAWRPRKVPSIEAAVSLLDVLSDGHTEIRVGQGVSSPSMAIQLHK